VTAFDIKILNQAECRLHLKDKGEIGGCKV